MAKVFIIVFLSALTILASDKYDQTKTNLADSSNSTTPVVNKWYYGGSLGLNFWGDYFLLSVEPLVGYKITPKFSIGGKINYTYINDKRESQNLTYNNYGGSLFARFRPIPKAYLHSEFVYANYESYTYKFATNKYESSRVWVPFILLGGGYIQPINPNVSLFIEVLFDVLQDENSPYKDWDPIVHFGVGVGF